MKPVATGKASGCLIWVLVFGLFSACLCPLGALVAIFSSTVRADVAARVLAPYLCPESSTPEIVTSETTTRDDFGNEQPATNFEMQCVNSDGRVVREASPDFAFYWLGLLAAGSLALSGLLALLLAAPAGALIARLIRRSQKTDTPLPD